MPTRFFSCLFRPGIVIEIYPLFLHQQPPLFPLRRRQVGIKTAVGRDTVNKHGSCAICVTGRSLSLPVWGLRATSPPCFCRSCVAIAGTATTNREAPSLQRGRLFDGRILGTADGLLASPGDNRLPGTFGRQQFVAVVRDTRNKKRRRTGRNR